MSAANVLTFSLVCEGAACGLFLMMAGVLWRDRRTGPAKCLSVGRDVSVDSEPGG